LHKKYTQNYKPFKKWWEYEQISPKTKPIIKDNYKGWKPIQRSLYFEDFYSVEEFDYYPRETQEEFNIIDEKPICAECFHDLEHDAFSNYHCCGCNGWFTESEVIKFRP